MFFAFELVVGKVPMVGSLVILSLNTCAGFEPRPCKHAIGRSIATVQWSDGCVKLRRVLEEVITFLGVR